MKSIILLISIFLIFNSCNNIDKNSRKEISLNGTWELTKTDGITELPSTFESKVPVPGLIDMATPAIQSQDTSYENFTFWYRKSFSLDHAKSDLVKLKINKAKYSTKVYLNNQLVGENHYCFTPGIFDIKSQLNDSGEENVLLIAIGCKNNLPDTVVGGDDFEKTKYIPGIYDDVKLILTNTPFIKNIQTVPDIENEKIRILADIETENPDQVFNISYVIREVKTKKEIAQGTHKITNLHENQKVDFALQLPDCKLWLPESPFLYELELSTQGDKKRVKFGMRSFSFDAKNGVALLNGKPYYMRGTNVCIFRFFEDPDRDNLPWDSHWVTKLHEKFREMNWNSMRYCIGFPPERWYEIADSLGFLVQDEYPFWTLSQIDKLIPELSATHLASEYKEWLKERWNHPSVVIWDAQNESVTDVTGEAIKLTRDLDLSNRPWDNGWAAPVDASDPMEIHPYYFSKYYFSDEVPSIKGPLFDFLSDVPDHLRNRPNIPEKRGEHPNPLINNEYGWIWLNRNGSPTTLTDKVYNVAFPEADTPDKRLKVYAKTLGILSEYWRVHRKCAAVMHFCGLGYSRPEAPRGQTSDHFIDIKNLTFEPNFYQFVKPAFNPVGLMIDVWDKSFKSGQTIKVPVYIINDSYEKWGDDIKLSLISVDKILYEEHISCELNGLDKQVHTKSLKLPEEKGEYILVAEIIYKSVSVKSIRNFNIE